MTDQRDIEEHKDEVATLLTRLEALQGLSPRFLGLSGEERECLRHLGERYGVRIVGTRSVEPCPREAGVVPGVVSPEDLVFCAALIARLEKHSIS